MESIKKIKLAFPDLPAGFYDVLSERIKSKGFSDERLNDAVNHVIDTCKYPKPTVANFISFGGKKATHVTYQFVGSEPITVSVERYMEIKDEIKNNTFAKEPKYITK